MNCTTIYFTCIPAQSHSKLLHSSEFIRVRPSLPDFITLHSPQTKKKKCAYIPTPVPLGRSAGGIQMFNAAIPASSLYLGMHPFCRTYQFSVLLCMVRHCIIPTEGARSSRYSPKTSKKCPTFQEPQSNSTRSGSCIDAESTRIAPSRICSSP